MQQQSAKSLSQVQLIERKNENNTPLLAESAPFNPGRSTWKRNASYQKNQESLILQDVLYCPLGQKSFPQGANPICHHFLNASPIIRPWLEKTESLKYNMQKQAIHVENPMCAESYDIKIHST